MSSNSFIEGNLDFRGRRTGVTFGISAGVKKAVKVMASRNTRRGGAQQVAAEIAQLTHRNALTSAELESYADRFLQASQLDGFLSEGVDDIGMEDDPAGLVSLDETKGLPSYLEGSLPDWMLVQLEAANGDAFAHLSLFEAKSPSPKAAISMLDEAQYA